MPDNGNSIEKRRGMLDQFETGCESGPIEDCAEREHRLHQLRPGEKKLAYESARLADLCRYFSQRKMDIPPDILDRMGRVSRKGPLERIRELADINQALIEYLHQTESVPQLRQ